MAGLFPNGAAQQRITGRKSACRAFAMHPDVAKFRMPFFLDEVVTNLVNQFEISIEGFAKCFPYLLENDQAIEDCKITAGRNCVQIVAIMF